MVGGEAHRLGGVRLEVPGIIEGLLGVAGAHVPPHGVLGGEVLPGVEAVGALEPGAPPPVQQQGALTLGHVLLEAILDVVVPPALHAPLPPVKRVGPRALQLLHSRIRFPPDF